MAREHMLEPSKIHHRWQRELDPALVIESGDTVHFDLLVTGDGQVQPGSTIADAQFDFETIYNLAGPIHIGGAEAGDILEIEILRLRPGSWGWAAILPDLGLLPEDFPDGYLRTFELHDQSPARIPPGVAVPLFPHIGTMGTHPGEPDGELPFPPHRGGGNVDTRYLTEGATLWVPIWCTGGIFSCGDAHAVQGDGEVCVTGLECPMEASLRFHVRRGGALSTPRFVTPVLGPPGGGEAGYHATMGIGPDLMEDARTAVRAMIEWLAEEHGLSREDAYILCSLAGELKILEVVDAGIWNVGMLLPRSVFQ